MLVFKSVPAPSVAALKEWQRAHGVLNAAVVPGFAGSAIAAGIRKDGRNDLGLIVSQNKAAVAGVFTQNKLAAAPVIISRKNLAGKSGRAILVNCGNANAATGQEGLDACLSTCRQTAACFDFSCEEVFPASTGVIGQYLPVDKINAHIPALAQKLNPKGLPMVAQAMMTTDAFPKMAGTALELGGKTITITAMAKGAGMIRPDMATMLAFVLSDVAIHAPALQRLTQEAANASFNRASVDGDTSTNDTLLVMANGAAQNSPLKDAELDALQNAVTLLCQKLAAMLVIDGEGAQHLILIKVKQAASKQQAYQSCYAVAHSPLCKTAFYGCDPNWGRLCSTLGALAGREDYPFAQERLSLDIGPTCLVKNGLWQGDRAEAQVAQTMKETIYDITLSLGLGEEEFWVFSNDLGHKYVSINADYRS
jgi:glutamate N-acetyltransferase/amino-acid N-acetyltransferase